MTCLQAKAEMSCSSSSSHQGLFHLLPTLPRYRSALNKSVLQQTPTKNESKHALLMRTVWFIGSQMLAEDITTAAELSRSNPNGWSPPIHFHFTAQWRGIVIHTPTFFFCIVKSHHQKPARVHEAERAVKVGPVIHTWQDYQERLNTCCNQEKPINQRLWGEKKSVPPAVVY